MPKKLIVIPEGNLMRVATAKGCDTFAALKEKTGVDRKTLRSINAGQQVKEATLQRIADKLRIPVGHLSSAVSEEAVRSGSINDYQYQEIKLQRLDTAALRRQD
jgi:hypothetical protein